MWISSSLSFSYHFPSPEKILLANCTQVPLWGSLTQESDTYEPRDLRLRASMGSASVRTSLKQFKCYHIDPADALETSGFPCLRLHRRQAWSRRRSFRLGSRDMAFHSAGRMHDLVFLVPVCHPFNR